MGVYKAELKNIMQKNIILGTAGHIDHGKTTLIHALTGTNTDRLPEEKSRGITIELGFTHLSPDESLNIGIVDVPGHEKFVHHMVAGVGGMDMVMLVVAADEGIMPQTREHLAICDLLGVKKGFIALTKIDMVDPEWLELVQEDVMEYLEDTFLADSPIVPVSAISGKGIQDVLSTISAIASETPARKASGPFRLPIDRVFTIRGFGTVVTGTVASGSITENDELIAVPGNIKCRIRGLQVHGESTDTIYAGQRAAINVQNVSTSQLKRGMMLTRVNSLKESLFIDAQIQMLKSLDRPLKHRTQIRFHTGTAEILGRVILFDSEQLEPGQDAYVQFRLQEPTGNLPGDRYIIRSYSPVHTLGGGVILDAEPKKHKRFKEATQSHFNSLSSVNPQDRLLAFLNHAGVNGLDLDDLERRFPDPDIDIHELIQTSLDLNNLDWMNSNKRRVVGTKVLNEYKEHLLNKIRSFHAHSPLKFGISREALRTVLKPAPDLEVLSSAIDKMLLSNSVKETGHLISDVAFSPKLNPQQIDDYTAIIDALKKAGAEGRTLKAIQESCGIEKQKLTQIFQYILDSEKVVRLPGGLILDIDSMNRVKELVARLGADNKIISIADFRDAAGISRKQAVPLLEFFDSIGITRRKEDGRVLL